MIAVTCTAAAQEARPRAAAIARAWASHAGGDDEAAVRLADEVLRDRPGDHDALAIKIAALSRVRWRPALDAYERWLGTAQHEDVFLLQPVARGALREIAAAGDSGARVQALRRLADSGETDAAAELESLTTKGSAADAELALAGDSAAAVRLLAGTGTGIPPETYAKAVAAAGEAAVPALRELLKHPSPTARMAAAMSLGRLGATQAVPELKALLGDRTVRTTAAVALARLGVAEGEAIVEELLRSDIHDLRLLAAEAYVDAGRGPWVEALMPLLDNPNGLTRIRAAQILAPVAPERAMPVLQDAAADPNPVVRGEVSRVLEQVERLHDGTDARAGGAGTTIPVLRRLLRDPEPGVRLHAAGGIMSLVAGSSR